MKLDTQVREYVTEVVKPIQGKLYEALSFHEVIKKTFSKLDQKVERLAEKFNSENIKIWQPYLEILIEKRLEDAVRIPASMIVIYRRKLVDMIWQSLTTSFTW